MERLLFNVAQDRTAGNRCVADGLVAQDQRLLRPTSGLLRLTETDARSFPRLGIQEDVALNLRLSKYSAVVAIRTSALLVRILNFLNSIEGRTE